MKKLLAIAFLCLATVAFALQGKTPYFNASLSSTATLVSGTPVYLSNYNIYNPNNVVIFVQFFDSATAGAVTVGTTTPKLSFAIPASGVLDGLTAGQIPFNSGLVIAATTTVTGSSAPSTALPVNLILQ